ncbi:MAG TPA: hypothetical protein VFE58_02845 [Tepidisphaeraceae bacterium]|jgi:uncharacterized protein (DUF58 family)|nr:hypothetical protein [Tepidisphaeraceae bacterium]
MTRVFQYYGRYQGLKGNVSTLPSWGKPLIFVAALPGILLILASAILLILFFLVSILALLLLTVPTYRFVRLFTPRTSPQVELPKGEEVFVQSAPRRQVDVKIIDSDPH